MTRQQRPQPLRLPVGQNQRMRKGLLRAVRSPPPPALSVAKEHAGEGLDLDKEDPPRRYDQGIDLVNGAVISDELDVRPCAVGLVVWQPSPNESERLPLMGERRGPLAPQRWLNHRPNRQPQHNPITQDYRDVGALGQFLQPGHFGRHLSRIFNPRADARKAESPGGSSPAQNNAIHRCAEFLVTTPRLRARCDVSLKPACYDLIQLLNDKDVVRLPLRGTTRARPGVQDWPELAVWGLASDASISTRVGPGRGDRSSPARHRGGTPQRRPKGPRLVRSISVWVRCRCRGSRPRVPA